MVGIRNNEEKELIIKLMKNRNGVADVPFIAEMDPKYLKFRSLKPYNEFAEKNVVRGLARMREEKKEEIPSYYPFT